MENLDAVGVEEYQTADEIEKLSFFKKIEISLSVLFVLLPNILFRIILMIGHSLWTLYRAIIPLPLEDIRGKIAVVNIRERRIFST